MNYETEIVQEGLVEIEVPKVERLRGPGRKSCLPFYNPLMRTNRDVSVLLTLNVLNEDDRVLDGLAATGVSGLRIAAETGEDLQVILNDSSPACHDLIARNIERNQVENCSASCENLNSVLSASTFDFVDVDPFGTPVRFVDGAIRAVSDGGIAAITATDTAVLCGSRAKVCIKRYGAKPRKTEYCHELGLRILLGYIARTAARYDKGIEPLVCFSTDHYIRALMRVRKGAKAAGETVGRLAFLHVDGLRREIRPEPGVAGPLWAAPFLDGDFLGSAKLPSYFPHKVSRLLDIWREEASSPPLFYTTRGIATKHSAEPPPLDKIINALESNGYVATRTHFTPDAFKTNAGVEEIVRIFRT